jgi:transcription antitermination factor NusG
MTQAWYAIRVRSNFEHATARFLDSHEYQVFVPTYRERREWSDRVKEIDAPLFSGYVFCRMDIHCRQMVVRAPGFLNIVSAGSEFLPVEESQIEAVRKIVNSPVFRTPWPYLAVGEKVVISRGPLAGVEGILVEKKNEHRLIVSVHLLQRSIAAEVSLDWVKPLKPGFRIPFEAASLV